MTQEEKQLLIKDLCARLPYGVIVKNILNHEIFDLSKYLHCLPAALENFKLYLRPMSSMTEEEHKEYEQWLPDGYCTDTFDWLLSHHFDHRHLIEKGLALKAPADMYKTE